MSDVTFSKPLTDEPMNLAPERQEFHNGWAFRGIAASVRYVLTILGLIVLIGALAAIKTKQISNLINMGKAYEKAGPPPEVVSSATAQDQKWEGTLSAVGGIAAAKGVSISNDAPGVVSRILFESGQTVRQGQVLVEIDSNVERAQIASIEARIDLAKLQAGRSRALVASNSISQAQVDTDEAQLKTASADLGALQAQIARKTVRAPFSGKLGIRQVNLGQYLNPGTTLTVLESTDSVYVDFTLPQQRLGDLKVGMPVRVTLDTSTPTSDQAAKMEPMDGVIAAIDPEIDSATRNIKLRASIPNKGDKLRAGMFARVSVILPDHGTVVAVPATSVVHASFGDSIFIVEDKKDDAGKPVNGADGKPAKVARQQFVRVGEARGDYVAILDGAKAGQEVVTEGAFKLRNNAGVVVNNSQPLKPQVAPQVENR